MKARMLTTLAPPTLKPFCPFLSHCSAVTSPGHEWSPRGYPEQLEDGPLLLRLGRLSQSFHDWERQTLGWSWHWLSRSSGNARLKKCFHTKTNSNRKGKSFPHMTHLVACTLRRQESVYHSPRKMRNRDVEKPARVADWISRAERNKTALLTPVSCVLNTATASRSTPAAPASDEISRSPFHFYAELSLRPEAKVSLPFTYV